MVVGLLWNFYIMFVTIKGRLVLILAVVALYGKRDQKWGKLVLGKNRCRMFILHAILMIVLFRCIPHRILSTKCANRFDEIWTVSKLLGVQKRQGPTFLFFVRFWKFFLAHLDRRSKWAIVITMRPSSSSASSSST